MDKTVSVVIPFYANANWLCEAVDSVLAQTYGNYEIIVVNDGSKEDVSDFLKKYGDKIKYYEKENGGAASARNEGIKRAEGDYIAFLDSDDLWTPQKLSVQLEQHVGKREHYTRDRFVCIALAVFVYEYSAEAAERHCEAV